MTDLAPPALTSTSAATTRSSRWRRHRSSLVIAVGLLVALVVAVIFGVGTPTPDEDLDPDNPRPAGARAVARVLADSGIDVDVVRSADSFDDARIGPDTTVVLTSAGSLGSRAAERLVEHAGEATVVVIDPTPSALAVLDLDGSPAPGPDEASGSCDDPRFDELSIEVDDGTTMPGAGCFDGLLTFGQGASGTITLLGAPGVLTNDETTRADNAAVALRLLGASDRLVWYVASPDDVGSEDAVGLTSLLPDAVVPGLLMATAAVVGLALWRGRRLGPLATEPLPVVVRAVEATRSRGRLYRRTGDRAHAAEALRAAARERARGRLRLGAGTEESVLLADVARHLGRPIDDVAALLASHGTVPGSDRDLIALADALAALDREVRRT